MGCDCSKLEEESYNTFDQVPASNSVDVDYEKKVDGDWATFAVGDDINKTQADFGKLPGVIRSRVGYTGGQRKITEEPKHWKDHTPVVDLQFDPAKITYSQLLNMFHKLHAPSRDTSKHHLSSKIFVHSKEQRYVAENLWLKRGVCEEDDEGPSSVTVHQVSHVFLAPKSRQQFYLQQDPLLDPLCNCSTAKEYAFSYLACKLNAFISGYANLSEWKAQLKEDNLGLDERGVNYLIKTMQDNAAWRISPKLAIQRMRLHEFRREINLEPLEELDRPLHLCQNRREVGRKYKKYAEEVEDGDNFKVIELQEV